MRHPLRHLIGLVAALSFAVSTFAAGSIRPTGGVVPGEVLVKLRDGASTNALTALEKLADADQTKRLSKVGAGTIYRMHSRSKSAEAVAAALQHNPNIEYVEANYIVQLVATPNDPSYSSLWGLKNIGQVVSGMTGAAGADIDAESAWNVTTGSASIVVGVVDTGVDYNHPDLAANIWSNPGGKGNAACAAGTHGFNAVTGTCDPMDDEGHGTHVSGTIGAVGNNGVGVAGVNWTTSIMALKFITSDGYGTIADAVAAIDFAVQAKIDGVNVRVLSNSWGGGGFSKALLDEINKANENDILFVASAGNNSVSTDLYAHYPSNYATPNMISVAATDNRDNLAYFSNFGVKTVHLAAPGVSVRSTLPGNSYGSFSGTSMAAPHVSGVAALLLAQNASLTTAQVKQAILSSVDPIPSVSTITISGGRLNAARALGAPASPDFTMTVTPATRTVVRGSSASYSITINASGGFNGTVALATTGVPTGATVTFTPTSTSTTATLVVTTSSSTPTGNNTLTVTGTSGIMVRSVPVVMSVLATAPPMSCPAFSLSGTYYPAIDPTATAIGDFNRDGRADMAVVESAANRVAIRLGPSFPTAVTHAVGSAPVAVATGDLNRDGKLDLVVANTGTHNISVLVGNGTGGFDAAVHYAVGTSPFSVATGDFNGDGKPDVAVANNGSGNVSVLAGQGDGTLGSAIHYAAGSGPFWIAAGDLDRDGSLDLAVANFNDNDVSVLRGNGDGTFQTAVDTAVGTKPSALAIADLNRDGVLDLAVANYASNNVTILIGNGTGGFNAPANVAVGQAPVSIGAGDFNADGVPDLLTANSESHSTSLLTNTGNGTFAAPVHFAIGYDISSATVGDLTNDGRPDVAIGLQYSDAIALLRNIGVCALNCGTLTSPAQYGAGTAPDSVATGDLNRDGKPDVVAVNNGSNSVSVLLGNGDGTFTSGGSAGAGTNPHGITTDDFNRDGKLDLAVGSQGTNKVAILLGTGDGGFQAAVEYAAGTTPRAVAAGDLNRDGKLDLAVAARGSDAAAILIGNGDGTFNAPVTYGAGDDPEAIAIGDFDRDGILDLVLANSLSANVSILRGNGDGTFAAATNVAVGTTPYSVIAGDLNGDGKLDVAVANVSSNNVSVLLGNGNGAFAAAVNYATGTTPYGVIAGDFNGDGRTDLATANTSGTVSLLFATDPGVFNTPVNTGAAAVAIAASDFNRDGKLDVAVANSGSGSVGILINTCPIADLTVAKTHSGSFTQGASNQTYTITVTNSGLAATTEQVTVTDTLPAGLVATAIGGTGWTCTTAPLTCTRVDALAGGASYPAITLTVKVSSNAAASVTNNVAVSGGGEVNTINNTASDPTTIAPATDLIVLKTHTGAFTQGATGRVYTITVRNAGGLATTGTVTVTDALPAGLTATALSGTGWACTLGTLTCTRNDVLAGGTSYPPITLTVNVAANAGSQLVNTATVSGGGDASPSNNTASDPTVVWSTQTCASFNAPLSYSVGNSYARGLAVGDFNADGNVDVATASSYNSVAVLLGSGNGTLGTAVQYPVANYPQQLVAPDLDNDGDLDLVVITEYGGLYVLLGNGNGTFATAVQYAATSQYLSTVAVADFNGDGFADVIVAQGYQARVLMLLGNGNGTLQAPVVYTAPNLNGLITVADFDGNGTADVAGAAYGGVAIMLGNGDGTLAAAILEPITGSPYSLAAGDFNADGKPDLAAASYSYGITVLIGLGDGTFGGEVTYTNYGAEFVTTSDINGDGNLDLVVTNNYYDGISTLIGYGNGGFRPPTHYPVYGSFSTVAVNDFNEDGRADLIVSRDYYSEVSILLGGCPELTITKTHTGNFRGNQNGEYQIKVKNTGTAYSAGTITVQDILPSGLTVVDLYGSYPWNCNESTLTCTTNTAIAGGAESTVYLTVKVSVDAPSSVTNVATVSGGGDINLSNNSASDPTTIVHVADLVINKTHGGGAFTVGQTITYIINVGNNGTGATSGSVTVTDNLPGSLSATGMSGTGWTCNTGTKTCTRSDSLAATSAYPPITLTATVTNVGAGSVTNVVSVTGGGDTSMGNNTAYDLTTLVPPPSVVIASANSASSINVTWNALSGATTYEVWRATSAAGGYAPIATTVSNFYLDRNVSAGTAYLYKVRALFGSTIGPLSDPDLATTIVFTDDPLLPGTPYKTAHILELRTAVNAVRAAAGMAPGSYTDAVISSGGPVRASHISDLRSALHAARIALGFSTPFYTDNSLVAGTTKIKVLHVTELRAYVK